jgi:hypothetical protein
MERNKTQRERERERERGREWERERERDKERNSANRWDGTLQITDSNKTCLVQPFFICKVLFPNCKKIGCE